MKNSADSGGESRPEDDGIPGAEVWLGDDMNDRSSLCDMRVDVDSQSTDESSSGDESASLERSNKSPSAGKATATPSRKTKRSL